MRAAFKELCRCAALVALLCVGFGVRDALAGVLAYRVDLLHATIAQNDPHAVAALYEPEIGALHVNGVISASRTEVLRAYSEFLENVLTIRMAVASAVYESDGIARYVRETFMVAHRGCLAKITSFETVEYDEKGSITYHESEWSESPETIRQELRCDYSRTASLGPGNPQRVVATQRVYDWHAAIEKKSPSAIFAVLENHAYFSVGGSTGDPPQSMSSAVVDWWSPLLDAVSVFSYSPTVVVTSESGESSVAIANMFVLTRGGCSSVFTTVTRFSHVQDEPGTDNEGLLHRIELQVPGFPEAAFRQRILADCTAPQPAHGERDGL